MFAKNKLAKLIILSLALVAIVAALTIFTSCGKSEKRAANEVYVYNWMDYIDPEVIQDFQKETGLKIVYEMFATNEDMYVKVKSGGSSYDLIFPSDYMIEKMKKEKLLQPINHELIPNLKNIDTYFLDQPYDPQSKYSVPYMWGTVGIIYNKSMIKEKVDSWNILWDPKYKKQIIMLDSPRDSLGVALKRAGYSMNSHDEKELKVATNALIKQKPLVLAYLVDEAKDKMIAGEAALSVAWSGDAVYMKRENPDLEYAYPKEGSNLWFDSIVIPANAQNISGAHKFIDFLCRPDIAKRNAEYIGYSTPNQKAQKLLPLEIQNDPASYPDLNSLKDYDVFRDPSDFLRAYDEAWLEVKSH